MGVEHARRDIASSGSPMKRSTNNPIACPTRYLLHSGKDASERGRASVLLRPAPHLTSPRQEAGRGAAGIRARSKECVNAVATRGEGKVPSRLGCAWV